jgi:hypothetical protein
MMALPDQVDVVIVGYGRRRRGDRRAPRALRHPEKLPDGWMAPRAIAFDNEALHILQMVGLPEGALAKVVIPRVRMHCPHFGEFARDQHRGDPRWPSEAGHLLPAGARALAARIRRASVGRDRAHRRRDASIRRGTTTASASYCERAPDPKPSCAPAISSAPTARARTSERRSRTSTTSSSEFLCNPDRPTSHMVAP